MSGLVRLFRELFGDERLPVATLELTDRYEETPTMRTDDTKIIADIFNDLYSKVAALEATVNELQKAAGDDTPAFDASLVTGYAPAPAPSAAPAAAQDTSALTDAQIAAQAAAQASGTAS
jgi:hypothetical protein